MELGTTIMLAVFGGLAVWTILRVRRAAGGSFDDVFTREDRKTVGSAAFYLAAPPVILASQILQVALCSAYAGGYQRFTSFVYWGVVDPAQPEALSHAGRAGIAFAGPASLVAVASLMVLWTWSAPANAAKNFARLELARILLVLALGVHPILSLIAGEGDLAVIREALNLRHPSSGDVALLSYGIMSAYAFYRWTRAKRLRRLATPLYDALRAAEAAQLELPDDPVALRTLGAALLANEDERATQTLERAMRLDPEDPKTALLLGRAHLSDGQPRLAAKHLRRAGQKLEERRRPDPSEMFEVALALSAARIALGDGEGAILTAEAAREASPLDPRGLLMHIDALVAGGEVDEAKARLEAALRSAEGRLRFELRRRLAALGR